MKTDAQCSVLLVHWKNSDTHCAALRKIGFAVDELPDWPADDQVLRKYHAVVVGVTAVDRAPLLAARIRVKRHVGRRVLIAIVEPGTPLSSRKAAQAGGFDEVLSASCDARVLIARILRRLRTRPELRCMLPRSDRRNAA